MNPRIMMFLVLPSIVQCFECIEEFGHGSLTLIYNRSTGQQTYINLETLNKNDYPNGYDIYGNTKNVVLNSTIVCSHYNKLTGDILFEYKPQNYEQFLKIESSNISTVTVAAFSKFANITKLFLRSIHVRVILPEAFRNLKKLRELYLADNELTAVSSGIFSSLHELEILDLSNNQIYTIEEFAFIGPDNLKKLFLNGNQLGHIDEKVFRGVKTLDILDLSQNSIKNFAIEDMTIGSLNLSFNDLQNVNFDKFPKFEKVDFSQNKICFVNGTVKQNETETLNYSSFNSLTDFVEIKFAFNQISSLEENIFDGLFSLEFLDLSHNKLTLIQYDLFNGLDNLIFLNLSHNQIERFRFGTFNSLKNLTTLDISHNRLLDLDHYTFVPMLDLTFLYFENNQINSFDVTELTKHFKKLRIISLADNGIWKCQDLVSISHHLKENKITMLKGRRFEVENLYGVECNSQIAERDDTVVDKSVQNVLKEISLKVKVNASVDNSSFVKFFNSSYRKTNFFQYFDSFVKNEISREDGVTREKLTSVPRPQADGNDGIFIVSLLVQIFIAVSLVVMIYLSFFKKFRRNMSQVTLNEDTFL